MATVGNLETDVEPLAGLMRDHIHVLDLVERAREAVDDALAATPPALSAGALDLLLDLDAYLAVELVIHIAKEEEVLFPALLGFAADIDQVVDEMVEQHDEIRFRKAAVERVVAALDHSHDEIDAECANFSERVAAVSAGTGDSALLEELLDAIKRLDWIFQGHFGDEEDDLFPPALELLSDARWAELAEQSRALDAR